MKKLTYANFGRRGGQIVGELALILVIIAAFIIVAALLIPPSAQTWLQTAPQEAIRGIAGEIDLSMSHGEEKHGSAAVQVRDCLNKTGPVMQWKNPNSRNTARVCQLEDGRYGMQIVNEEGKEITAFVKDKMKTIDQVIKYLRNTGYEPIQ